MWYFICIAGGAIIGAIFHATIANWGNKAKQTVQNAEKAAVTEYNKVTGHKS